MPDQLIARLDEIPESTQLLSHREEIALLQVRICELLQSLSPEAKGKEKIWREIGEVVERKARLIGKEAKLLGDLRQAVPTEQVLTLIAAIKYIIYNHVQDRETRAAINEKIDRLIEGANLTGWVERITDRGIQRHLYGVRPGT